MAVLKYEDGVSFAKTCDLEAGGFARRQLILCGTEGTLEIQPLEVYAENGLQYAKRRYAAKDLCDERGWSYDGEWDQTVPQDRYDAMMEAFHAYVCGEKENPYTYDYEITLFQTLLQCCGGEL